MNKISKKALAGLKENNIVLLPSEETFNLPEKVLQFGTGVLLRGLPDYFIDKANQKGIFNGSIVVVKSTDSGDVSAFDAQDNLYTLCVRGIENDELIEENRLCSAISRVLSAQNQWLDILNCAMNPDMQIIISNTTEVGIQLIEDDIYQHPPKSFPGKLLAFLYERFKVFNGSQNRGMVIVPTELIPDNGKKLKIVVLELARQNGLDTDFLNWIENSNHFCNSLVDRIVPGKPRGLILQEIEKKLGYQDDLLIISEVYRLWAIEGNDYIKSILTFYESGDGVVIEPDIELYRELKLRLLNGTHTLSCGLAFLSGFKTVKDAMQNPEMSLFIAKVMLTEIAVAVPYKKIDTAKAIEFGKKVLDRFRSPYIEHNWINITVQYSSKMLTRDIPLLLNYYKVHRQIPFHFTLGFAAYLLFMKVVKRTDDIFYGEYNDIYYPIQDDKAAYFYEKWQSLAPDELVKSVLQDHSLWGTDLNLIPNFTKKVIQNLEDMLENGVFQTMSSNNLYVNHEK